MFDVNGSFRCIHCYFLHRHRHSWAATLVNVDRKEVARGTAQMTVPAAFTASETFDVGVDLGSPVALDYFDRPLFRFDGTIRKAQVQLK